MSTSDIKLPDLNKGRCLYLFFSAFCFLFGVIYENYSHEVYSPYMVFAVGFPLLGGAVVTELLSRMPKRFHPNRLVVNLYNAGIATFTVGSLLQGALEIYGTENPLMIYYKYAGCLLTGAGIALWLIVAILRHFVGCGKCEE